MTEIQSIGSLCAPQFSPSRHAYTGAGWFFGAGNVHHTDGTIALHMSFAFETRAEAIAAHRDLKGKLT